MSAPLFDGLPIPRTADAAAVLRETAACLQRQIPCTLATVLARRGSAPATPGQKLLLALDGTCVGTVGGGALERSVLQAMQALLEELKSGSELPPKTLSFNLGTALGMCCGGGVELLLEPLNIPMTVLIVGAGHVGTAVAPMLQALGFTVVVSDEREEWAEEKRFPAGIKVVAGTHRDAAKELPPNSAIIVMTHDHALDEEVLEWSLSQSFSFVGGVGSRAKHARITTRLRNKGLPEAALARVRMPVGVSIGARTPAELAVAISAEMVAVRRGISLDRE